MVFPLKRADRHGRGETVLDRTGGKARGDSGAEVQEVVMDQDNHGNSGATAPQQSQFSPEAFAMLGAPDLAYVRPVETQMGQAFGIFAANGQHVGLAESADKAFAAARQHDLAPVYVH